MNDNNTKQFEMPYFKLFVRDEIANFSLFGLNFWEYGAFCAFRNLIFARGFLPSEKKDLAKILRISVKKFEEIWENISPMFSEIDGKLTIPELELQRAKYNEFIEKSREGGQKSAENRGKVGSTDVEGSSNAPSSSLKPKLKESHSLKSKSSNFQNSESNVKKKGKKSDDDVLNANGNQDGKEYEDGKEKPPGANASRFHEQIRNDFYNFYVAENKKIDSFELMNAIRKGDYDAEIKSFQSTHHHQN